MAVEADVASEVASGISHLHVGSAVSGSIVLVALDFDTGGECLATASTVVPGRCIGLRKGQVDQGRHGVACQVGRVELSRGPG